MPNRLLYLVKGPAKNYFIENFKKKEVFHLITRSVNSTLLKHFY